MANIQSNLNKIKNAVLGVDVRDSIHDGIKAINEEVENTTDRQVQLEGTFDELVINAGNSNAEVAAARVDSTGKSHGTLGKRLNNFDSQIKNIAELNIRELIEVNETDNTQAILNLFSTINYECIINIPYGIKFNQKEVYEALPTGVILRDKSLNSYKSEGYRVKNIGIVSGDVENNDTNFQIISNHHPCLVLNNLKTSGTSSATKSYNTISFCDGLNEQGLQSPYFFLQAGVQNNKYSISLRNQKDYSTQSTTDSTALIVYENGEMYNFGNYQCENKGVNLTTITAKNTESDGTSMLILNAKGKVLKVVENGNNGLIQHGSNTLFSFDDNSVTTYSEKIRITKKTGSSIDVTGLSYINITNTSPTTITEMIGENFQKVTLIFGNGNTTLSNTAFKLKNNASWTPTAGSSITLLKYSTISSLWIEISRTEM